MTGSGYGPHGEVVHDGRPVTADRDPDLVELLGAVVLCNDATLRAPDRDNVDWAGLGDPTEAALLAAGAKLGLERSALEQAMPRVAELPFDSARRRMTTVHRLAGGGFRVLCKGAPEVLVRPEVLGEDADTLAAAASQANDLARGGYRTLAVAVANRAALPADPARLEAALSLLGLVAIADPPRAAAAATIRACQAAGITPVLITGDHPATARATAERLGIIDPAEEVVVGAQLHGDAVPAPARVRSLPAPPPSRS